MGYSTDSRQWWKGYKHCGRKLYFWGLQTPCLCWAISRNISFCSPPYMQANHFYEENIVNARLLFQGLSVRRTPWLLTYGYRTSIAALVEEFACLFRQRITKVAQGRAHTGLIRFIIKPAVSMKTGLPPVCLIFPAAIAAVWLLSSAAKAFISSFALNQLVV